MLVVVIPGSFKTSLYESSEAMVDASSSRSFAPINEDCAGMFVTLGTDISTATRT